MTLKLQVKLKNYIFLESRFESWKKYLIILQFIYGVVSIISDNSNDVSLFDGSGYGYG